MTQRGQQNCKVFYFVSQKHLHTRHHLSFNETLTWLLVWTWKETMPETRMKMKDKNLKHIPLNTISRSIYCIVMSIYAQLSHANWANWTNVFFFRVMDLFASNCYIVHSIAVYLVHNMSSVHFGLMAWMNSVSKTGRLIKILPTTKPKIVNKKVKLAVRKCQIFGYETLKTYQKEFTLQTIKI